MHMIIIIMNLPCDAVTVLMVITCALIYKIGYWLLPAFVLNKLLQHSTCILYIISASRCTVYTCNGVAYAVNLLYICLYWCDPNTIAY